MPYRLRLFSGDHLLLATDSDTTEEAGVRAAEWPLDDLLERVPDGSSQASLRRELVYRDETGGERPATPEEDDEVFQAMARHSAEIGALEMPPCPRCGRRAAEQDQPYPTRGTLEGPICFGCWTPEERERLLPPGWPRH